MTFVATTYDDLPTELYLPARPGSVDAVEYVCALATGQPHGEDAVAVAVAPANVSRAAELLFGTGVGIVSLLHHDDITGFLALARVSAATGATEIAVPREVLDQAVLVTQLKSFLGSSTPVTVDITTQSGDADLAQAECALALGADFVSFLPVPAAVDAAGQTANLVTLAQELQLGGVKLGGAHEDHLALLGSSDWAMAPGNARRCLPVDYPSGDLRP